ncbi:winged helix-turn-helix transcriptional regulator [Shewanella baltica]|uniref:winged helix-turn-helix transcriptional regulator n=1 Tax=Shewanella baltica TaxID=62322 RepID=UPI00217D17FC|nr:helix-turn-helix domain-containing protein [Shewanella baltica]MCS6097075.1 helix-turn-helix transcriptional regulator [Shewanella baltica]MCS6121915.1 helix-turn-helix transcriptional regulator [Shewanella baltica]MCS6228183.1 helix-turn-helix transcriptional regulator [Shewanella baltica]
MKRKNLSDAECPVARSLDVIGDGWSLLIIRDAFDGISRFSAFQKNLGIARSMLTARLLALVEQGVLETIPASDGTAYQEYVLTEMGRGLFPVIIALRQWGEDHLYQPDEQHSVLIDTQTGEPVTRLELRSKEHQVLEWRDTAVRKVSPDLK